MKKDAYVKEKREKPTPRNKDLANEFACGETTISDILKNADKWLQVQPDSTKSFCKERTSTKVARARTSIVDHVLAAEQDLTGLQKESGLQILSTSLISSVLTDG